MKEIKLRLVFKHINN